MNLPNKLTILRVLMIPVFLFVLMSGAGGVYSRYIATAIFVLASATDALDGHIARKYNLITNFGKFMDPMADKLLVCSALIALIETRDIPSIAVIIIIAREFIISGFRLIASDNGVVIAASKWGKLKTISQMVMIIYLLLGLGGTISMMLDFVMIWVPVVLTIISAVDYIIKNLNVLKS
ncbi:CDP-diacylglycerol--glycerol-3-phosphate 3-phosphatidyltransferase [Tyzzerella sp. OttesenSCG-928-J15]|nr:CDP-diacylglycerol--glycerol-3-phosphate 3-phosphatidyltransferase [Tyzzerella sp. OttesenSCG-928-J15]